MRVAASSSASGRPSRRRQISVTAVTLSSVSAKVGAAAVARWQNRATDGTTAAASAPPGVNGGGTGSGCNGRICSPSTPSGSRLVASTVNPGQSRTRLSTRPATAPSTCSQLSSRRSIERPRRYSTSVAEPLLHAQCRGEQVRHRGGVGHRGQLANPGPVAVARPGIGCNPQRQPGLAHSADAAQSDDPEASERRLCGRCITSPPHQVRQLQPEIPQRARCRTRTLSGRRYPVGFPALPQNARLEIPQGRPYPGAPAAPRTACAGALTAVGHRRPRPAAATRAPERARAPPQPAGPR
jgi:hypothetical protein